MNIYNCSVTILNSKTGLRKTIKMIASGDEKSILISPDYFQRAMRILEIADTFRKYYSIVKVELGEPVGQTNK